MFGFLGSHARRVCISLYIIAGVSILFSSSTLVGFKRCLNLCYLQNSETRDDFYEGPNTKYQSY